MPTLHEPKPMTPNLQLGTVIHVVLGLFKCRKVPIVAEVTRVVWDSKTRQVVPASAREVAPLYRVPCEDGSVFYVCPWCARHQVEGEDGEAPHRHRFEAQGLFWHGQCQRPSYQYTAAECGQEDYDRGW